MATKQIDIKNIIKEIHEEVYKRSQLKKYKESLTKLFKIAKRDSKDVSLYTLKMKAINIRTVNLPVSERKGFVARLSNKLIMKLYFLMTKMLNDASLMQYQINMGLIDEVSDLKSKISTLDTKHFPYIDFLKKFPLNFEVDKAVVNIIRELPSISFQKVVIMGVRDEKIINELLELGIERLFVIPYTGFDISLDEKFVDRVRIIDKNIYEYLGEVEDNSIDLFIVVNEVEYTKFNFFLAELNEIFRVLKKGGSIVCRTLSPQKAKVSENIFDPMLERLTDARLLEFMMQNELYEDIKTYDNYKNLEDYYVTTAKKA